MNEIISKYETFLSESIEMDSDSDDNTPSSIDESHLIVINSIDREYKNDNTSKYSISVNNNTSIRGNLRNKYNNIFSICISHLFIPNKYIDLKTLHGLKASGTKITNTAHPSLQKLNDTQYIILKISDIKNNVDGTNSDIFNCTSLLVIDDAVTRSNNSGGYTVSGSNYVSVGNIGQNLVSGADNSLIAYKTICAPKIFMKPKSSLSDLKIELFLPNGKRISYLNDYLVIDNITYNNTDKTFDINTTKYFSPEEYSIGDTLIFKSVVLNTSNPIDKHSFHNFINRKSGHTIIGFNNNTVGNHGLYKTIQIPIEYNINLNNGTTEEVNFNCNDGEIHDVSSGDILNQQMQHVLFMNIILKKTHK